MKPNSTGSMHSVQAKAAAEPRNIKGCDSLLWLSTRVLENRKRDCARCSAASKTTTTTSSKVASCAAAMRLSITSHAL